LPAVGDTGLEDAAGFYERYITDRLSLYTEDGRQASEFPAEFWDELAGDYREVMGRHPRGSDRTGYAIANEFIRAHGEAADQYFTDLQDWSRKTAVPEVLDGLSEKNLPVYADEGDIAVDDPAYDTVSVDREDYEAVLHAYTMKTVIDARMDGRLLDSEQFDEKPVITDT
jgi:hypothetical protein